MNRVRFRHPAWSRVGFKDDGGELFAVIAAFHFISSFSPLYHVIYPHFVDFFLVLQPGSKRYTL